jgi:hypothetical protein
MDSGGAVNGGGMAEGVDTPAPIHA